MAHYLIGFTKVIDPAGMSEYIVRIRPTVEQYGGRFVFEGDYVETLEGTLSSTTGVVMHFDDAEAARRWYYSTEYAEVKKIRVGAGESHLVLMREFA